LCFLIEPGPDGAHRPPPSPTTVILPRAGLNTQRRGPPGRFAGDGTVDRAGARSLNRFQARRAQRAGLAAGAAGAPRYLSGSAWMVFTQLAQHVKTERPPRVILMGTPIEPRSSPLTGQTFWAL